MTVSHLTRTRDQLWSDLLVALGGDEAFLTRSLSERQIILEILDTYDSSISLLTIDDVDALLAAVVNEAGGSASHLRQNKHEILAALVTALGGTAPSSSTSSTGELLAAAVNAAEAGAGGTPEWVPADAKIYIDLVNDRAWTEADGEVAIDTLLGADANTINAWGSTFYNESFLTADGYHPDANSASIAFIGAARTQLLDEATIVVQFKQVAALSDPIAFVALMEADGNDAIYAELRVTESSDKKAKTVSYGGPLNNEAANLGNTGIDAVNVGAVTVTATRMDIALNGGVAVAGTLTSTDRPSGDPFVAALVNTPDSTALQYITIYDALPSTAGLSELSETGV